MTIMDPGRTVYLQNPKGAKVYTLPLGEGGQNHRKIVIMSDESPEPTTHNSPDKQKKNKMFINKPEPSSSIPSSTRPLPPPPSAAVVPAKKPSVETISEAPMPGPSSSNKKISRPPPPIPPPMPPNTVP